PAHPYLSSAGPPPSTYQPRPTGEGLRGQRMAHNPFSYQSPTASGLSEEHGRSAERSGHGFGEGQGAHAVARDAAGGVGGPQEVGNELTVSGPILCALHLPRHEASGVEMVFVQFG